MFFGNGPLRTQSDSTMIAKWPSSDAKSLTNTQTDPKMIPKRPQSHSHMPQVLPKWPRSDAQMPQSHPHMPKVNTKWSQSCHKVIIICENRFQSRLHMPKVMPKWPQNGSKVVFIRQKWPKKWPKVIRYSFMSFTKSLKFVRKMNVFRKRIFYIPKVNPQWLQSDHQVTQSHPLIPKLTPN